MVLGLNSTDFFNFTPAEILDFLSYNKEKVKMEHELMFVACKNAIGKMFSKGYKYVDVFEKSEKVSSENKELSIEEKKELDDYMNNW